MINGQPQVLIVSDVPEFSTIDVFEGLLDSARQVNMGEYIFGYRIPELLQVTKLIRDYKLICKVWPGIKDNYNEINFPVYNAFYIGLREMLNPKYDYILFVSAVCVPTQIFKILKAFGKKILVLGTDDPQSTKIIEQSIEYVDFYLTNERTLCNVFPGKTFYVPMATPIDIIFPDQLNEGKWDKKYAKDIVFIGSVYPSRIPIIEKVCWYAYKNDLSVYIGGHTGYVDQNSIIANYTHNGIIDSMHTRWYYNRSKIVINLDRDPDWNPKHLENIHRMPGPDPQSTNPRFYEVPVCNGLQVYINPRQEAKDILGDNLIWCTEDDIEKTLEYALSLYENEDSTELLKYTYEAKKKIVENHTYIHRLNDIWTIISNNFNSEA